MDMRLGYDGTLMATLLQLDLSTKPAELTVYEYANREGKKKGVELLGKLGFQNTYAVAVNKELAATIQSDKSLGFDSHCGSIGLWG
jgi:glycine betaine/choline ABC-type transport system substrate-binding protein